METTEKETTKNPLIEKLFSVGAHFGYTRTRRHPSISPFIFGVKNRVEIFDLERVSDLLEAAKHFVYGLGQHKKTMLFVCGKHEALPAVRKAAQSIDMPFVAGRWIGGTLTNFNEVKKRIERLDDLRTKRERGELEKYTKREQLDFDREIADLEKHFGGLITLKQRPAALFVIDAKREKTAVKEARDLNIPIVGLMNSDGNLKDVTHPIVGNDSALKSITFFVEEIAGAYRDGLLHPVEEKQEKQDKSEGEKKEEKKSE